MGTAGTQGAGGLAPEGSAAALAGAEAGAGVLGEPAPLGDAQDLGMGVLVGFLLGFLAMICLVEGSVSQRMRLGICVGVSLQLAATAVRIMHHAPGSGSPAGIF